MPPHPPRPYLDRFVGRRHELEQLALTFGSRSRLVTLVGAPGSGKSRLAQEFANLRRSAGVPWASTLSVDLANAKSASDVLGAFVPELRQPSPGAGDVVERGHLLGVGLAKRGPLLLVLDNVEHVGEPVTWLLRQWLEAAPDLSILCTSRVRLRGPGEHLIEVKPLGLPPRGVTDLAMVLESEAVQLFLERSRAVWPDLVVEERDAPVLAEITHLLGGLPLALELAAARASILSLDSLRERLAQPAAYLAVVGSSLEHDERQDTLTNAIAWSWSMLSPTEARVLAQCWVFHGFDAAAAEAVVTLDEPGEPREPVDCVDCSSAARVIDMIQSLRDKSLISSEMWCGTMRLKLLVPIATFAGRRLTELGLVEATRLRHARYYAELADERRAAIDGASAREALRRIVVERGNLTSVVNFACEQWEAAGSGVDKRSLVCWGLRASLAIVVGLAQDVPTSSIEVTRCGRLVEIADAADVDPDLRVHGRLSLGIFYLARDDPRATLDVLTRAADLTAAPPADTLRGRVLSEQARAHLSAGELVSALALGQEALRWFGPADQVGLARALNVCGHIERNRGALDAAHSFYSRALQIFESLGATHWVACMTMGFAEIAAGRGDPEGAIQLATRARRLLRTSGATSVEGLALIGLADALSQAGRTDEALATYDEAWKLVPSIMPRADRAWFQVPLAHTHLDRGEWGAACARRRAIAHERLERHPRFGPRLACYDARWAWISGREELARVALATAAADYGERGAGRLEWLCQAQLGALEAASGNRTAASQAFAQADELGARHALADDPFTVAVELYRAHLRLPPARPASPERDAALAAAHDDVVATLALAFRANSRAGPVANRSNEVRRAAERLLAALPHGARNHASLAACDPGREALVVHKAERWFRPPGGDVIELASREMLYRLLVLLIEARQPLSVEPIAELIWPGEYILPDAARNRIYHNIKELRRSGVGALLESGPNGYMINVSVPRVLLRLHPVCTLGPDHAGRQLSS